MKLNTCTLSALGCRFCGSQQGWLNEPDPLAAKPQAAVEIDKEMEVLIDEVDDQGAVARCYAGAPEIDGSVFIESTEVKPGDKVRVRIVDADEYNMWAELI